MYCQGEIIDNIDHGWERNFDQLLTQSDDEEIDITNKGESVDTLVVAPEESESEADGEVSGDNSDAFWSSADTPHYGWTFTAEYGPGDVFNCVEHRIMNYS